MPFGSRYDPQTSADGYQSFTLTGSTQLLSALVTIPPNANSCVVQVDGGSTFAFVMDGSTAVAASACLSTVELQLVNRQQMLALALAANTSAVNGRVQFFTGRSGAGIYPP